MGITYYGLVNGHDIYELIHAINRAKQHEGPVLIHAITRKGMGYKNAEKNPEKFHGEPGHILFVKKKNIQQIPDAFPVPQDLLQR